MLSRPIRIICGHFGAGKSNVAVNLAAAETGRCPDVTFADLDIVNPYFRSADAKDMMESIGIKCVIPDFANTNVDVPSLPANVYSLFEHGPDAVVFLDVGGDNGAVVLGAFASRIAEIGYDMLYVTSMYRPLTEQPEDAVEIMREIEMMSRLRCTAVLNNSSIGVETVAEDVVASVPYARRVAKLAGLPYLGTAYYEELRSDLPEKMTAAGFADEPLFPMRDVTRRLY